MTRFEAPAWLMLPLWLVEQLLMMMFFESSGGVAYSAHVGGFLFGLFIALAFRLTDIDRSLDAALEAAHEGDEDLWSQDPHFDAALAATQQGDHRAAIAHLQTALRKDANREALHEALLQNCIALQDVQAGKRSATFLLRRQHDAADHDGLVRLYRKLRAELPGFVPGARELAYVVESAQRLGDPASVVQAAGTLLLAYPDNPLVPRALWTAAEVQEQNGRTSLMRETLERLATHFPRDHFAGRAQEKLAAAGGGT
jgi:tetratricopeptide (TPR) repeat protein